MKLTTELQSMSRLDCMLFHHHSYIHFHGEVLGQGISLVTSITRAALLFSFLTDSADPTKAWSLPLSPLLLFSSFVVIEKRETSPIFSSIHTNQSHSSVFCFPILLSLFSFISSFCCCSSLLMGRSLLVATS